MSSTNIFANLTPEPLAADDLADFQPKKPADDLADFKPRPLSEPHSAAPPPILVERAAEAHGFTLNNFPPPKRKTLRTGRVASKDKTEAMTLRLRIADWNRFSTFCENQGLTVADGFSHILNKSGI
jgi:hypothetical protein